MEKISIDNIKELFLQEFSSVKERFDLHEFSMTSNPNNNEHCKPGVYVFFKEERVWKVGKSNENARKRALEHFRDDTGSAIGKGMKQFENDPNMILLLFLVKNQKDVHWVFALEAFFEQTFRDRKVLEICSFRIG